MTVAKTILEQLGGKAFIVMTGAKNFTGNEKGLSFKLPGKPGYVKDGINVVSVTLMPDDTYNVQFSKSRGRILGKLVKEVEGVYFEQLPEIFREATGLETRMPRFKGLPVEGGVS